MKVLVRRILIYSSVTLVALVASTLFTSRQPKEANVTNQTFPCTIDLAGYKCESMNYSCGFHYEMMSHFAKDSRCKVDINIPLTETSPLDSLREGSASIIAIPYQDSLGTEFRSFGPFADSVMWVVRASEAELCGKLERWQSEYFLSAEYADEITRFGPSYEPEARVRRKGRYYWASPYDELFKKYAPELGWDWRLLAALVWQESRFRIEARSRRGAFGLMQMMPKTASRYNIDNMLDPEQNLAAGAQYLGHLQKMFRRKAAEGELPKFIMAAYNAGEGRIVDCINFAKSKGEPYSTWDDLTNIIPLMRNVDTMAVDTVARLGAFKGVETIGYVDRILGLYDDFCLIAP